MKTILVGEKEYIITSRSDFAEYVLRGLTTAQKYILEVAIAEGSVFVARETEKAVQMKAVSGKGTITFWVPKSSFEQAKNEMKKRAVKTEDAFDKYNRLVEWAKNQGVKGVRKGLKKDTIIYKLNEEQRAEAKVLNLI